MKLGRTSRYAVAAGLGLAISAVATALALTAGAAEPGATAPVVVELFQSQGCSSCPPANANVNLLAQKPGVLALSFSVTYWDSLGWKDTFARPEFTQRQWAYARGLHHSNVYTPQVVIDGRADLVGSDRSQLEAAVQRAGHPAAAAISLSGGQVSVAAGASQAKPADVWLVRYDPRVQQVPISRGENSGRTLPHKNIVRQLVRLGGWNGAAVSFRPSPPADAALRTAILVQAPNGGPILAAATS